MKTWPVILVALTVLLAGCTPTLSAKEYAACQERVEKAMLSEDNGATLDDYRSRVASECGQAPATK